MRELQLAPSFVSWQPRASRWGSNFPRMPGAVGCARSWRALPGKTDNDFAILTQLPTGIKPAACVDESQHPLRAARLWGPMRSLRSCACWRAKLPVNLPFTRRRMLQEKARTNRCAACVWVRGKTSNDCSHPRPQIGTAPKEKVKEEHMISRDRESTKDGNVPNRSPSAALDR